MLSDALAASPPEGSAYEKRISPDMARPPLLLTPPEVRGAHPTLRGLPPDEAHSDSGQGQGSDGCRRSSGMRVPSVTQPLRRARQSAAARLADDQTVVFT